MDWLEVDSKQDAGLPRLRSGNSAAFAELSRLWRRHACFNGSGDGAASVDAVSTPASSATIDITAEDVES